LSIIKGKGTVKLVIFAVLFMTVYDTYEVVVGLEVHAQLLTRSKLFCGDSTTFGDEPNTNISPISLAHPGTLPKMNKKAIEYAIRLGLACHAAIEKHNYFARKNYFYPDLPKGYQISQHTTPICKGGYVKIHIDNNEKKIRLNRIHLEEDAGKSLHDLYDDKSALDFNRAGTALVEIVSEPDLRSADEAYAFLTELRKLVRYLGICDGNMEEGSFRCDANISVRKKGEQKLGTKVEVKNLNSIRNVKRAILFETERMVNLLENGNQIFQQTRSFDADAGTTFAIREKEEADDYRYFPEPDLTPFQLTDAFIEEIQHSIPPLQEERIQQYLTAFHLSEYDAKALTEEITMADYFEQATRYVKNYKALANWILGPVKTWLNEQNCGIEQFPLAPAKLASVIRLVEDKLLSFSAAASKLLPRVIENPDADVLQLAEKMNLLQESDVDYISPLADEVLLQFGEKVNEYRRGKKGLLALFVGEIMKRSKGKADPVVVNKVLLEKLNS
jgi:aspartyl-tRNA(Asn)/glutamyl-tRNA(Gln) amidotransferase subunit B